MAGNERLRWIRFLYHYWPEYAKVPRFASGRDQTSGRPLCASFQVRRDSSVGRPCIRSLREPLSICRASPGVSLSQGFSLDPFPIFTYEIEGIEIEKTVFMVHGENSTIIQYQLGNVSGSNSLSQKIALELRPLIAFRDYHSTTHENSALNSTVASLPGLASITPYPGLPSLHLAHNAGQLGSGGNWYRNFEYDAERERGLDFVEDLFNPCVLRFDLRPESAAVVIASTEPRDAAKVDECLQAEICRRARTLCALRWKTISSSPHCRRRSVHRRARQTEDRHCRLSLVQRLGPRHHDCPARPHSPPGPI